MNEQRPLNTNGKPVDRRLFIAGAGALAAIVAGGAAMLQERNAWGRRGQDSATPTETSTPTVSPSTAVSGGAVWGLYHGMGSGWDRGDNDYMPLVGNAVPRTGISYYSVYDGDLPNAQDAERVRRGTVPQISLESKSYKYKPNVWTWRDIAAGKHDAAFRNFATKVGALGGTVMLCLDHEADEYYLNGYRPGESPADYVAAWRHVKSVMAPLAPNAVWIWWAGGSADAVAKFYPGDGYVSLVGADAYRWPHHSSSDTPAITWGRYWDRVNPVVGPDVPRAMTETSCDIKAHGVDAAVKWWSQVADTANDNNFRFVSFFSRSDDGDWTPFASRENSDGSFTSYVKPGYEPVAEEIGRQIAKMSGTLNLK